MNPSAERFRSVSDFPATLDHLDRPAIDALYNEMRACLTFTNRSRAQQIRRKEEYKKSAIALQSDVARLPGLLQQLAMEKTTINQDQSGTIQALEQELTQMSGKLDRFSKAFDDVESLQNPMELMSNPGRFFRFWAALKDLIFWWREQEQPEALVSPILTPAELAKDRLDNPQMYTDPASIQRSERQ